MIKTDDVSIGVWSSIIDIIYIFLSPNQPKNFNVINRNTKTKVCQK